MRTAMRTRVEWIGLAAATVTTVGALITYIVALVVLMYPVARALQLGP